MLPFIGRDCVANSPPLFDHGYQLATASVWSRTSEEEEVPDGRERKAGGRGVCRRAHAREGILSFS